MCLTITSLEYPTLPNNQAYKVVELKNGIYRSPTQLSLITPVYKAEGLKEQLYIGNTIYYVIHVFPDKESAEVYRKGLQESYPFCVFTTLACKVRQDDFVAAGTCITAFTSNDYCVSSNVVTLLCLGFSQVFFPTLRTQ